MRQTTTMVGRLTLVTAALLTAATITTAPARAAAAAAIDVFPVPAVSGQQVSVVGHGFCATGGCSQVTVSIEGTTVLSGVKVSSDGGFTAAFTITVVPGDHDVTASQHTGDGDRTATAHLIVLPPDNRTTPTSAPTPRPRPSGTTGGTATTGPSPRTNQASSATTEAAGAKTATSGWSPLWWAAGLGLLVLLGAAAWAVRARHDQS